MLNYILIFEEKFFINHLLFFITIEHGKSLNGPGFETFHDKLTAFFCNLSLLLNIYCEWLLQHKIRNQLMNSKKFNSSLQIYAVHKLVPYFML